MTEDITKKIEEEMNFLKNTDDTYDEGVAKGLEIALKIIKGEWK